MGSQKSSKDNALNDYTVDERIALEPQRERGRLRVAALMQAGAAVIAERGFEAATMAEIAARAEAPIGSLYRFFPNKEVLADALMLRYGELIDGAFEQVREQATACSNAQLADTLLDLLVTLHGETQAMIALLNAHAAWSDKREQVRATVRRHIAAILYQRHPALPEAQARAMAEVLLQNMKAVKALQLAPPDAAGAAVQAELREMTRVYLEHRLGPAAAG